jgi:dolichol-phosphate mannosyltransferase
MVSAYVYKKGNIVREQKELLSSESSLDVSVVLPTYNEEANIGRLISEITNVLHDFKSEIVVVDDNSKDKTPQIMDDYAKNGNVAALHRYGIKGIFSAILDGIKVAEGKTVVIMDADFSHPPSLLPQMLAKIPEYDIVSGSRFAKGGKFETPFIKKFATTLFNKTIRFVMGPKITDWTGGFHAMKKDAFEKLRFKYPADWGEFDLELLYRARKAKLKIAEVPFFYSYRNEGAKSAQGASFFFGYAMKYGLRALRLRFFDWI